jgi:hypothetical protein
MKISALVVVLLSLASPALAGIVHDESVNGDLGTNPAAPTALAFAVGGNTVLGTVSNVAGIDRDYITFTIAPNHMLTGLNLIALAPDNIAFASFNAGTTSFVPSVSTAGNFLSGIHITAADAGSDLMPLFVSSSVTGNSLPAASLGPGDYCFLIQQTSPITQSYSLEFVIQSAVPVEQSTWGRVKALFR